MFIIYLCKNILRLLYNLILICVYLHKFSMKWREWERESETKIDYLRVFVQDVSIIYKQIVWKNKNLICFLFYYNIRVWKRTQREELSDDVNNKNAILRATLKNGPHWVPAYTKCLFMFYWSILNGILKFKTSVGNTKLLEILNNNEVAEFGNVEWNVAVFCFHFFLQYFSVCGCWKKYVW